MTTPTNTNRDHSAKIIAAIRDDAESETSAGPNAPSHGLWIFASSDAEIAEMIGGTIDHIASTEAEAIRIARAATTELEIANGYTR